MTAQLTQFLRFLSLKIRLGTICSGIICLGAVTENLAYAADKGPVGVTTPKITEAKPDPKTKTTSSTATAPKSGFPAPPPPGLQHNRWENGLDILLTSLFGKKVFDLDSPSFLLEGLWSHKFISGTYLGLVAIGSLQPMAITRDNAKISFTTYGFGPYLAQDLYRSDRLRLLVSLSAGRGYLFVRRTPTVSPPTIYKSEYFFYEPGLTFIFHHTRDFEVGPVINYRAVSLANSLVTKPTDDASLDIQGRSVTVASRDDISGLSLGISIRATTY